MTPSVNLLPVECLLSLRRTLRAGAWAGVWFAGAMVVLGAWLIRSATADTARRVAGRLESHNSQGFVLEKQIQAVSEDRDELVETVRGLAALRPRPSWPARIATLARLAPPEVVLSYLAVEETRLPPKPAPVAATKAPPPTTANPPPPGQRAAGAANEPTIECAILLRGLALAHDDVTRLIEALRDQPEWEQVELLRATRQQIGASAAITFEIKCAFPGETP